MTKKHHEEKDHNPEAHNPEVRSPEEPSEAGATPNKTSTKPGFEQLMIRLDAAEQKAAQHWDRILRMQAESENAARRTERDITNAHKFALEKFVNQLLPVIDNLERAIEAGVGPEGNMTAVLEGVDMTLKMLYTACEKSGVIQINPLKQAFNPSFHEAISTQEDATCKPGTVLAVLQKGYTLNDRLVRPAMVIVSK